MTAHDDEPRLVRQLKPAMSEQAVSRVWRALEEERSGVSTLRRRGRLVGGGVALALCLACFVLVQSLIQDQPLSLSDARDLPATLGEVGTQAKYELSDGSRILLGRGAQADVLRNDGSELVTVLHKGKSVFDVRPGGRRRWSIEAGVLTVQVLGTAFSVEREAGKVRVQVERGVVLVRGERVPDRAVRLTAGHSIELSEAVAPLPVTEATRDSAAPIAPEVVAATDPMATMPAPTLMGAHDEAPVPPASQAASKDAHDWQHAARRGAYEAAFRALERQGAELTIQQAGDVKTLLTLADVARRAHAPEVAAQALAAALKRESEGVEAQLAAFTLGKLELEALGRPRDAVAHFAWVVSTAPSGPLAEDALARLVEAELRCGMQLQAQEHARTYATLYPQGRWAATMQRSLKSAP